MSSKKGATALPVDYLSSVEEHIENALILYLERIHAPEEAIRLFDNLITILTRKHQSSSEDCEQIRDALTSSIQNMAAIDAPFYGPHGEVRKIKKQ
ncbi:MAG: hypothetical protein MUO77_19600 [Anaerolineales bacterium]|nr:hypothetical protein [Anaerolineales bacterium]